ncbi:hypothetical protein [Campylobacter taeniopygiae]|uniref:Uncharacterized protein n=1 Tax=Campylobacter taeniopygiae TaxID=2510188 RepID=A0ABY2TGS2_9BACT|nr:hypothetical protein [Campylobacter taeniopygiae]TKX33317.1 hypothetical protein CQA75_08090 [Campylobacter taeniopygiae]
MKKHLMKFLVIVLLLSAGFFATMLLSKSLDSFAIVIFLRIGLVTIGIIFCSHLLYQILKPIYRFLFVYKLYEYKDDERGKALFLLLKNADDFEYIIFSEFNKMGLVRNDVMKKAKIMKYKKWLFLYKLMKNYIKKLFKKSVKVFIKCKIKEDYK